MRAYLYDRKDANRQILNGLGSLSVEWLSWAELGGPDRGRLRVDGPLANLQQLHRVLRSYVKVVDQMGSSRWWGFVEEVEIHLDGVIYAMSLDGVANRVAVRWSEEGGSPITTRVGYDYQTPWADHVLSQIELGMTKEMIFEIGEAREAQALAARATRLASRNRPAYRSSSGGRVPVPYAYLRLAGWIHTVGWRFYSQARGYVGNLEWAGIVHELGNSGPHTAIGQVFTAGGSSPWQTSEVWLRLYKVGNPADSVVAELRDSAFGGTPAASATVAASTLEREPTAWEKITWTAPATLTNGVNYSIVLYRTGANDPNHYYAVRIEQGVKLGFNFSQWQSGVGWTAEVPNASMVMGVMGYEETTVQVLNVLASTAGGQFLTGVRVGLASGIYTRLFRQGKERAIDELKALLLTGTAAGDELRATISEARVMEIDARPAQPASAELFIFPSGEVRQKTGGPLLESPVGKWARVLGLENMGGAYNPTGTVYITRAEWEGGRLRVKWA